MDTATLKIVIDAQNNASAKLKEAGKDAEGAGLGFGKMAGAMAVGNLVADAASKAAEGVSRAWTLAKDQAKESAQAQAQLNSVLESTHHAAGLSAEQINKMADEIMKTTPIDGEAALAAENMLLTFTNIHKEVFPAVTKATVDMATAMNGGATPSAEQLRSTAVLVGKALNDPAVGLSKLTKVGVTFTDQQKEQIKTMEAAGNMTGAQKIMTEELAREFGGSAAAAAQTFSGQVEMLKNRLVDLGGKGVTWLQGELVKLGTELMKHKQFFIDIGNVIGGIVMGAYHALSDVIDKHREIIKKAGEYIATGMVPIIVGLLIPALWSMATAVAAALWPVLLIAAAAGALGFVIDKLVQKLGGWKKVIGEVQTIFHILWDTITGGDPTLKKGEEGFGKFVVVMIKVRDVVMQIAKFVGEGLTTAWKILKMAIDGLLPSVMALFGSLWNQLRPALEQAFTAIVRLWNALNPALMDALKIIAVIIGVTVYVAIWLFINVLRIAIDIISFAIRIIATIVGWIANLAGWFGTAVVAVAHFYGSMLSFFSSLPGRILGALGAVGSLLYQAGRDIVQGMINGIEHMAGAVFDKVKSLGSKAVSALKGVLKIFSPSGVFHELGQHVGQGLANGIASMADTVSGAAGGLGNSALGGSTASLMAGGANVNSTTNTKTTTIGQVVLASPAAVQEFFKQVDQDTMNLNKGLTPSRGL
jgi:hypothetical protein